MAVSRLALGVLGTLVILGGVVFFEANDGRFPASIGPAPVAEVDWKYVESGLAKALRKHPDYSAQFDKKTLKRIAACSVDQAKRRNMSTSAFRQDLDGGSSSAEGKRIVVECAKTALYRMGKGRKKK